ncbi:hypothetical protein C8R45DRAFT_455127 [Mycena sanguinolenta]|nr:hypothetical protein C8R45DRAFT_455127 [Mycena sanguinolenta]
MLFGYGSILNLVPHRNSAFGTSLHVFPKKQERMASIPPLNKISLIGIWIETALWGMNFIIFGAVCAIMVRRSRDQPTARIMLSATSTLLFLLCTTHVAGSLRQLLEAFIYIPPNANPLYSTLYFIDETNPVAVMKTVLYDTTVFVQDIVLIWRLYIVWGRNWKICVVPIIVELAHMGTAYAATALLSKPDADIYANTLLHIGPVGWSLDLAVNIFVTAAIAGRLWWMGRKVASLQTSSHNPYLSSILTIVESGGLFAAVTIVMLTLYEIGSPLALTGIDISTQLAALTPLLIIVRVALGLTHNLPSAYEHYLSTHATSVSTFSAAPGSNRVHVSMNHTVKSDTTDSESAYALSDIPGKSNRILGN